MDSGERRGRSGRREGRERRKDYGERRGKREEGEREEEGGRLEWKEKSRYDSLQTNSYLITVTTSPTNIMHVYESVQSTVILVVL